MKKLKIPIPKKNEQYKFVRQWYPPSGNRLKKNNVIEIVGHGSLTSDQKLDYAKSDFDKYYFAFKNISSRAARREPAKVSVNMDSYEKRVFWKSAVCEKHFVKVSKK